MTSGEAQRILIVEDEAVVAVDLQTQIESLGYTVVDAVATADEARRAATRLRPDLIIMDIRLGKKEDGIDTARSLRQMLDAPVVFLTAFSDAETVRRASETGAYGYLVKPFNERELFGTIQTALQKARLDQGVRRDRDDLLAILDTQRQGTVALDENGLVSFVSRAAETLLEIDRREAISRPWKSILPLSPKAERELETLLREPDRRRPLSVELHRSRGRGRVVEVEVQDDCRDAHRKFLFLYDVSQLHDLRQLLDEKSRFENIVGKSDEMRRVFQLIAEVAPVDASVLIEGETGTGKELVARAIHHRSRRSDKPFLALNCAGLGEDLAASQLFGHRRGAFTGALEDRPGLFEAADGGTLLLDEVAELPTRVQTMLLRVLEEKAVRRLGDADLRPVDVRLIAATNRQLSDEVDRGTFRGDLLYRLRVCRIHLPPLRQRKEDIPLLVRQLVGEFSATMGKAVDRMSDEALSVLVCHDWPGNVRELRNAIEFAVIRARGSFVQPADLPPEVLEAAAAAGLLDEATGDERGRITAALRQTGGNRKEAARLLGISRATLYRRLADLKVADDSG